MTADQIESFFALAIGFAVAGLVASAYQLVTCRPASFRLLGEGPASVAAVPLIAFAAPFIIMRNIIRGCRLEGRPFAAVLAATILAGGWSLMSGTVVVMALGSLGIPAG
jgi:hypothetical protein